jgi:hypothetical protein
MVTTVHKLYQTLYYPTNANNVKKRTVIKTYYNYGGCSNMFRFTKKPSSGSHSQYLAKITHSVQCGYVEVVQTLLVLWLYGMTCEARVLCAVWSWMIRVVESYEILQQFNRISVFWNRGEPRNGEKKNAVITKIRKFQTLRAKIIDRRRTYRQQIES